MLGLRCYPTHHAPDRRYYKTRNMLYVWRKHGRRHPRWVLRSAGKFLTELLEVWLFEDRKASKTLACLQGTKDFLLGRYGARRGPVGRPAVRPT